jgi:hypothetical protein
MIDSEGREMIASSASAAIPAALTNVSELLFHIPPNYEGSRAVQSEANTEISSLPLNGKPAQFRDEKSLLWVSIPQEARSKNVKVDISFSSRLPELELPATFFAVKREPVSINAL